MYSVTIDGILILNCAFEPEDYLRGDLGYKKICEGHPGEGGFSCFREQFSGFAMTLS